MRHQTSGVKKHDLPAMPFYIGDWKKAPEIRALSLAARGLWFEMLLLMWESTERGFLTINGQPMTIEVLARQVGFACDLLQPLLAEMELYNVFSIRESDKAIYCRKMVRDSEISKKRILAGSKGGFCSSKTRSKMQANNIANTEDEIENENEDENKDVISSNTLNESFENFWKAYPRKEGKGACKKIWAKLKPSGLLLQNMLEAISNQKQSDKWQKDGGQYIPMPSTWLNQSRWEDEITPHNDFKPLINAFSELYKQNIGKDYLPDLDRDIKHLRSAACDKIDLKEFQSLCQRFFDPEHTFRGNCDIPSFIRAINRLRATKDSWDAWAEKHEGDDDII